MANLDFSSPEYAPAQEAIAILIEMAKRGEINPWDVQVIEVIDRCLSILASRRQAQLGSFEANLFHSGQAFLYASMLVLLKADTLANPSLSQEAPLEVTEDETEFVAEVEGQLPPHLERHLRRRPSAQPLQKRPVTLQELISQLQQMATVLEDKVPSTQLKRVTRQSNAQAAKAIAELAHQENLTETATQLDQFLSLHWSKMSLEEDWLNLEQLLDLWVKASPSVKDHPSTETDIVEHKQNHRVGIFWALLLLSAQSKVELSQEEFYQEIKIRAIA